MRVPATIRWVALALLGLLIAAGVSVAASSLVSQQIGLASEPISAGDALAPRASSRANRPEPPRRKAEAPAPRMPTEPAPSEPTAPPPGSSPSDGEQDYGGGYADD